MQSCILHKMSRTHNYCENDNDNYDGDGDDCDDNDGA